MSKLPTVIFTTVHYTGELRVFEFFRKNEEWFFIGPHSKGPVAAPKEDPFKWIENLQERKLCTVIGCSRIHKHQPILPE